MPDAVSNNNQRLLNRTGAALAFCMVIIFGGGIWLLATRDVPQANHDILLVLITAVASIVGQFMSYFFGSSAGAKAKDDALATSLNTAAKAQDALAPIVAAAVPNASDKNVELKAGEAATVTAEK